MTPIFLGPHVYHLLRNPAVVTDESIKTIVFGLHGRTSSHAMLVDFANETLRACPGIDAFVLLDFANHGEREVDSARNLTWREGNDHHAIDMFSQIYSAFDSIRLAIDLLPAYLRLKSGKFTRIGVMGVSQGGHAAILTFYNDPRVDVCVSVIGSMNYPELMRHRFDALNKKPLMEFLYPPALADFVQRVSIGKYTKETRARRRILLLNGTADGLVPAVFNDAFFALDEGIEKKLYEGVGHQFTEAMARDAVGYLKSHM